MSLHSAAQFTFNRERDVNLSCYMEEEIPEETDMDLEAPAARLEAAAPAGKAGLSGGDNGQSAARDARPTLGL